MSEVMIKESHNDEAKYLMSGLLPEEEDEYTAFARKLHIASLRKNCFTSEQMQDCRFDAPCLADANAVSRAEGYVDHWEEMQEKNIGLLFWGGVGTGKTWTAACVANALIDQNYRVLMRSMSNFLNAGQEDRWDLMEAVRTCPLFILDDFGMERGTDFGREILFSVLDARAQARKPILITTNLTLQQLDAPEDLAQARICDRVRGMTVPILFGGDSIRKAQRLQNLENYKKIIGLSD